MGSQRPYSWAPATALQLVDDVEGAYRAARSPGGDQSGRPLYVLGAVILHADDEAGQTHVVDGQQRLLTLTMLLDLLDGGRPTDEAAAPSSREDPQSAVVRVRTELARRVKHMAEPAEAVAAFVRDSCEVIRVVTDDADEAFRVFDSQNYRGKSLRPHDLLKAHHLREMRADSVVMTEALVEGWQSVPDAELDRLFSTYLWRVKQWTRGLPAPAFTTRHIDAFKGLTPSSSSSPAARYHLAAQAAVPMLGAWVEQSAEDERAAQRTRFQLDAPVVAGRPFFEMVTFMLAELQRLRAEAFAGPDAEPGATGPWEQFASTDEDFRELSSRARYRYVSELYLAALLYCTNRFGAADHETRSPLFTWAYSLRTRYQRVQLATVDKHAASPDPGPSAFVLVRGADTTADLRQLPVQVAGRAEDPEHEQALLRLLTRLGG